jgi:hypothetical protein
VTIIIVLAVGGVITRLQWPTQLDYLSQIILRPWRLLHGQAVCPACRGAHEGGYCQGCLAESLLPKNTDLPSGYVSLHSLRTGWNWREWHPRQPVAYGFKVVDGQPVKVPVWHIPPHLRA